MFESVSSKVDFPALERRVLEFWEEHGVFAKSIQQRENQSEFVFYDGPPFATGLPHYGHLLAGTIKDVVPRYQTMRGKRVARSFGWDCHGLPVEYEMEKKLNLSGKKDIEEYGVGKFNEACRGIVLRYTEEWKSTVKRMGRWVDFDHGYLTMDLDYMESIWQVFKRLWDMDLIYEGHKILPYCPRCSTPLSNFEANLGYAEVEDPAITIRFKAERGENRYFLAWTTTPWTLPSNLALAVGPDILYVEIEDNGNVYVLAQARLSAYYKNDSEYKILRTLKGSELSGERYEPLFPYFADMAADGAFRVVTADYVTTDDGAGIVHTAPGFGEDDAETCRKHNIPEVCPVDEECRYTRDIPDYQGVYVKDADKPIIKRLKEEGKLVHRGTIRHNYPHCYRDDTPLIYRAVSTWFVRIDRIKEKMLAANQQIHWTPEHIKEGRFGKWLENARDWAISRNRFWGCPLPIWRNEDGETVVPGSVAELETLTGKKVTDIHKHYVDDLEIPSSRGGAPLRRIPEVLDCWFESGSMPYAQKHYPFENKEWFDSNFPADFIAEGLDQTRGWFYTLVVLGAALFDRPAFKNVVVNGLILAEDGQKMSKRKKNYPDPGLIMDAYSADALRLYMLGSPVVRGDDLRFSENGVRETLRGVMLPIWNAYSFFVTYANVDDWRPAPGKLTPPDNPSNPLDRWILSSLREMVDEIRDHMDNYQLQSAANRFEAFIEDLTNWYIRRGRRRFWKSQNDSDKNEAYQTLYFALITFCETAAPFIPFVTEEIYRNLRTEDMPESIHLRDYPEMLGLERDIELEEQMRYTIAVVSLGRYLRAQTELKTRQPLRRVTIVSRDPEIRRLLGETETIIAEELNVKDVAFMENEEDVVTLSAKANFKVLGPKLGKRMKEAAGVIAKLSTDNILSILSGEPYALSLANGDTLQLSEEDLVITRTEKEGLTVANDKNITVALDTALTPELLQEGFAREIVSRVQNLRKEMGFDVTDRIRIQYAVNDQWSSALTDFGSYICQETLAVELVACPAADCGPELDINGEPCHLSVTKVGM